MGSAADQSQSTSAVNRQFSAVGSFAIISILDLITLIIIICVRLLGVGVRGAWGTARG